MKNILLQEDDCAPDARASFIEEMKKKYNLIFGEFKEKGKHIEPDDMTMEWHYKNYVLSISADSPYYLLYKEELTK